MIPYMIRATLNKQKRFLVLFLSGSTPTSCGEPIRKNAFMRSFRGIMRFCGLFLILHDLGVVPLLHSVHGSKVTEQNIKEHDQ